jgi:hypothetical protein
VACMVGVSGQNGPWVACPYAQVSSNGRYVCLTAIDRYGGSRGQAYQPSPELQRVLEWCQDWKLGIEVTAHDLAQDRARRGQSVDSGAAVGGSTELEWSGGIAFDVARLSKECCWLGVAGLLEGAEAGGDHALPSAVQCNASQRQEAEAELGVATASFFTSTSRFSSTLPHPHPPHLHSAAPTAHPPSAPSHRLPGDCTAPALTSGPHPRSLPPESSSASRSSTPKHQPPRPVSRTEDTHTHTACLK